MSGKGASREYSSYQQGVIRRAYEHKDTIALQKLSEIVSDLYLAEGNHARKLWERARAALVKLIGTDPRAAEVLAKRDVQALARLVGQLSAEVRKTPGKQEAEESLALDDAATAGVAAPDAALDPRNLRHAAEAVEVTPELCKRALRAFRKRLKLKKLDDESRLGRNPLTSGKQSQVVAIMAPREFPTAVWEELARQGKLRHAGGSFYELVE